MSKQFHASLTLMLLAFLCLSFDSKCEEHHKNVTLEVRDAWIRVPIEGAFSASLYFKIYNSSIKTDYLINVEVDISEQVQIYKTVKYNGVSKSIEIEKVALPAKTEVKFEPMGIYLLMSNFNNKITKGDKIKFKLIFTNSGPINYSAVVK